MKKRNNYIFNIVQKWRHFIVAFLLVVFFSPYGIKVADVMVHHHYTSHYVRTPEAVFSIEGHLCPIPGFKYHSFVFQQPIEKPEGIRFLHKVADFRTKTPYVTRYTLSFSLRAPPMLDNIS